MGCSLACAVRATPDAAGWLVALADMPYIATRSHQQVAAALRSGASIAATEFQGRRGHPVGAVEHAPQGQVAVWQHRMMRKVGAAVRLCGIVTVMRAIGHSADAALAAR